MSLQRKGLIAAAVLAFAAATSTGSATPPTPAAESLSLGALKMIALRDGVFATPNNAQTFGVDAGATAVTEVLKAAGAPTETITVSINALLIFTQDHVVLIDTGLGPRAGGILQASLAKAGVTPESVTDVLITHSHGDHIGGLIDAAGGSAFPKAVVRMSAKEWAWVNGPSGSKALVRAVGPQVKTFEPGAEVLPGITPVAILGHTPGHVGYEIVSGSARMFDLGDTAHSSIVSLAKPEWTMGFDLDAKVGKESRRATLTRLASSHELVYAPHFPFPGVGHVVSEGNGFAWRPAAN